MSAKGLSPKFKIAGIFLCVIVSIGFARTREIQEERAAEPLLQIVWQNAELSVKGNVSSAANEAILRKVANDLYAENEHEFTFRNDMVTPPGWALLTEMALRAISQTNSANGLISAERVHIRGITADSASWLKAAMRIEESLPAGMHFISEVMEIKATESFFDRCDKLFHVIWHDQSIAFPRGSDQISSSAHGIMDELVQLIADCPGAKLTITGHTDNTGDEHSNIELSRRRAKSVAAYMIERGISPDRLISKGVGSAKPLLNEDSYRARGLNRRIEIDWNNP